ncbi:MAG: domain fused to wHTH, Ig, or Glycine-rich motif [Bacteroidetes bacterium]|nr:domain fused to wHTH, Ig, or Glycine-rich motif [Bacteroidota bacterium]
MKFRKVKKNIHVGYSPGEKYLAQPVKGETIDFKAMAAMIEKSTTVSRGDTLNVLDAMATAAVTMIKAGHNVKFDGLGIFDLKTKVKAMNTPEEVTADTIERITIGFIPTVELKDQMKSVSISIDPYETEPTPPTP